MYNTFSYPWYREIVIPIITAEFLSGTVECNTTAWVRCAQGKLL